MAELGITQQELADALGMHPTKLNHVLKGRREPPADFYEDANAALDRLAAAKRAGREAEERTLRELAGKAA